jgi:transcriptional regulator with XRE-family HTH domain
LTDQTKLASRILEVRQALGISQREAAELLRISLRAWQNIERGESVPSGETLLKFKITGFNPGWILSGLGPKLLSKPSQAPKTEAKSYEAELVKRLARLVVDIHQEQQVKLRPEDVAAEAAELYNELARRVEDLDDAEEVDAVFPQLKVRLKKRLAEATAEPGTGKRQAS